MKRFGIPALMGVLFGLVLGGIVIALSPALPMFSGYVVRPACADTAIAQLVTTKPVKGIRSCLGGNLGYQAMMLGLDSDAAVAEKIGNPEGRWYYRGQTIDGGFVYEVDHFDVGAVYTVYVDSSGKVTDVR